jgi:hypothetical protein
LAIEPEDAVYERNESESNEKEELEFGAWKSRHKLWEYCEQGHASKNERPTSDKNPAKHSP